MSSSLTLLGVGGPAGGGALISPDEIDNLELWLKADTGVLDSGGAAASDGENVATWEDQSGNGLNFTQGTDSLRPTWEDNEMGGMPVVRFVAADANRLASAGPIPTTGTYTYFVVMNLVAGNVDYGVIDNGRSAASPFNGVFFRANGASGDTISVVHSGVGGSNDGAVEAATDEIFTFRRETDPSNKIQLWRNGSEETMSTNTINLNNPTTDCHIGSRENGTIPLNGDIAEIIVYSADLSTADREAVEEYLADKYSITLA